MTVEPIGIQTDADMDNSDVDNKMIKREICVSEGEMLALYDERELIVHETDGNVEPFIGMEFESEEAAMAFYDVMMHMQSGKVKRLEVRKPREVTREGCKTMIMVRKEKSGKWVVTKLETVHSHPLGIPAGKGHRGTTQARPQLGRVIVAQLRPGLRMKKIRNFGSYHRSFNEQTNSWQSAESNWKWF
ncbi:hypothetical protein Vadar_012663 [Vaccinium darrowii]|uniref:Uncharacterized protein n=1 Tax=Vaccinium darrowii TaxID=229202 RepID=A0ACB7YNC7_9ERIC|nr:hypothetical protein Vadar_012663 [Vaccinium darrowii]